MPNGSTALTVDLPMSSRGQRGLDMNRLRGRESRFESNFSITFPLTMVKMVCCPFKAFLHGSKIKKRTHLIPFVFRGRCLSTLGFNSKRVGVCVQREFSGSVPFIRWSDKVNHETEIWSVLVWLAWLQKIVKCRDKHWQLPLRCHIAASFTAMEPWVSRRYSCFLPSRVNKCVGDPLTFHP